MSLLAFKELLALKLAVLKTCILSLRWASAGSVVVHTKAANAVKGCLAGNDFLRIVVGIYHFCSFIHCIAGVCVRDDVWYIKFFQHITWHQSLQTHTRARAHTHTHTHTHGGECLYS